MTCPGCGFVSFPDVERCKQCGYEFDSVKKGAEPASADRTVGEVLLSDLHSAPLMEKLSPASGDRPWGDDISEGVGSSKRRRAGIRGRFDSRSNMKFEFDHELRGGAPVLAEQVMETTHGESRKVELVFAPDDPPSLGHVDPGVISLEEPAPRRHLRPRRTIDLEQRGDPAATLPPPLPAVQPAIRHERVFRPAGPEQDADGDLPVASAVQRLLAGIVDGAIILLCFGIFAGIFFVSGGHIHFIPANLVILGLVASMLVFGYFGTFSAITHATPGGQWRGISIRNLEGDIPTTGQSLLRAFGYLVAAAAFMIGFLWIVMDSGGMGWHDHMSGTLPLALGKDSQ